MARRQRDLQNFCIPPRVRLLPLVHGPHRRLRRQVGLAGRVVNTEKLILMIFFNWAIPVLFFVCFRLFKQTLQFLQENNVEKCQSSPGIQTHNLQNMSQLN